MRSRTVAAAERALRLGRTPEQVAHDKLCAMSREDRAAMIADMTSRLDRADPVWRRVATAHGIDPDTSRGSDFASVGWYARCVELYGPEESRWP